MKKPILVVASQFPKDVEERIDREYEARRNTNPLPFTREQFLAAAAVLAGKAALALVS